MREFTLIEMQVNEAIFTHNNPIETQTFGTLLSEVSETHGLYTVPSIRVEREIEIEY